MDTGWLDIRLNALLPHCRFSGGTQYISDTITRLLKRFRDTGGELPFFQKAFLAIVEHRPVAGCGAFDQDNKGFKAVINSLKGRVFARMMTNLNCRLGFLQSKMKKAAVIFMSHRPMRPATFFTRWLSRFEILCPMLVPEKLREKEMVGKKNIKDKAKGPFSWEKEAGIRL